LALACRDELYKECAAALDGGAVLSTKNLDAITDSIQRAFATVDANLSTWSGPVRIPQNNSDCLLLGLATNSSHVQRCVT
jgi:hypothetical protein